MRNTITLLAAFVLAVTASAIAAGTLVWLVMLATLGRTALLDLGSVAGGLPRWSLYGLCVVTALIPNGLAKSHLGPSSLAAWPRFALTLPCVIASGLALGFIEIAYATRFLPHLLPGDIVTAPHRPGTLIFMIPSLAAGLVIHSATAFVTRSWGR